MVTETHIAGIDGAVLLRAAARPFGRPVLWALAAAGQAGVEQVINSLTEELALVMAPLEPPTSIS